MFKRTTLVASLIALFLICVHGYAEARNPVLAKRVDALKQRLGPGWKVQWNREGTALQSIWRDIDVVLERKLKRLSKVKPLLRPEESAGSREEVARSFLRNNADLFQVPADLGDLHLGVPRHALDFQQDFSGLPVIGSNGLYRGTSVEIDSNNVINSVTNNYLPRINISTKPQLTEDDVIAIAKEDLFKNHMEYYTKEGWRKFNDDEQKKLVIEQPKPELFVYVTEKDNPILAYRFDLKALPVEIKYFINANTGEIILAGRTRLYASGSGNVFDPNPVNSLNDTSLLDLADSVLAVPSQAYVTKPLNDFVVISGRYVLKGPYVSLDDGLEIPIYFKNIVIGAPYASTGAAHSPTTSFLFDRSNIRFEHVMAYQVIDSNQRYIQSLGFPNLNRRSIKIDPHGQGTTNNPDVDLSGYVENTSYPPGLGYISLGTGGIDDAEDADIILHEYGHAIQNNQAPKVYNPDSGNCNTQAEAMGEGFGDYWAASNTRAVSIAHGFDSACFAEWDNAGKLGFCRRRLDSPKKFADYKGLDCHADGEIWSSALWEILTKIGTTQTEAWRRKADQLILQSHYEMQNLINTNPALKVTFALGGLALLNADKFLVAQGAFAASRKTTICKALRTNRGISVPTCP